MKHLNIFEKFDNMKEDIIKKFGSNSTGDGKVANPDIQFPQVTLSDGSTSWSFYTYQGDVCTLDNYGCDTTFEDYPKEDQALLYNSIMGSK